jgi:hypothetical protein
MQLMRQQLSARQALAGIGAPALRRSAGLADAFAAVQSRRDATRTLARNKNW